MEKFDKKNLTKKKFQKIFREICADERIARKIRPIPHHFLLDLRVGAPQQNVTGTARAEQVEATSKSELSMSTLQKLVCNLEYSGARKPDIFRITTLVVGQIQSGTKFKAAFEIYFSCRPLHNYK
jgi:hypothetical protein